MVAPEARIGGLRRLIDDKAYFVIHAPRQSGKTTSAQLLAEALTAEGIYAAVLVSCKPGAVAGNDIERGVGAVVGSIDQECRTQLPAELRPESPDALRDLAAVIAPGTLLWAPYFGEAGSLGFPHHRHYVLQVLSGLSNAVGDSVAPEGRCGSGSRGAGSRGVLGVEECDHG